MKLMIDPNSPDHWKFVKLARLLYSGYKLPEECAIAAAYGHVAILWCRVVSRAETGDVRKVPGESLAIWGKWPGDWRKFAGALLKVGLLDKHPDGGYLVHDWLEHQGDIIARRERDRERKRQVRSESARTPKDSTPPGHPLPSPAIPGPAGGDVRTDHPPELGRLLEAFAFCRTPGARAKSDALLDLRRQGVADDVILGSAQDPQRQTWDFYQHVKALRPSGNGQLKSPF